MNDLERVKQDGLALQYVKNQTPKICLAAVKQNGYALQYVKKQTPEICLAAVKQNGYGPGYMPDCHKVFFLVKKQTPELCMTAVKQDGCALLYIEEQTPEICLTAVQQDGTALSYVKEQTPEICLAAVQENGWALKYVKEQTQEICLAAVQQDGATLKYVKEQTPEICLAAIKKTIYAFNYVNITFDISPIKLLLDKKIDTWLIYNNFIRNLFVFKIDKPDTIKQYLEHNNYNIKLIKLLQEYNYAFSKEQILESIKHKVEIPHIHQYEYNLNDPEFIQVFKERKFHPESYNLDMSLL